MNEIHWMKSQSPKPSADLSWLSKDDTPARPLFTPAPKPQAAPAPKVETAPPPPKAPEPPPPPPGPSPEELRLRAECEQLLQATSTAIRELEKATRMEIGKSAEIITEMGLCVAEELAAGAIDVEKHRITSLVGEALALLNAERDVKVYLNPDVYDRLSEGGFLDALRKAHQVTVRPEARVADRGCIVESPLGQVDARVRSRLRQLRHLLAEKQGGREE